MAGIILGGFFFLSQIQLALGSAPSGLHTTVATSSTITVGPANNNTVIFATSSNCTARVIASRGYSLMLRFTNAYGSTTLSGALGYPHATATTVVYDAGLYGCDAFVAYAQASATIDVIEFR